MSGQDHGTPEPVNERILPIPPVVAGLFIASGWLLNHFVPLQDRSGPAATESRIAGAAVVACAFAIAGLALLQMRRSRTTFHPGGRANALVQGGVFQRSRNPMYLSLTLLTLGLGIAERRPMDEPARTPLAALPPRARGEARRGVSYPEIWGGVCGLPEQGPALVLKKYRDVLLAYVNVLLTTFGKSKAG